MDVSKIPTGKDAPLGIMPESFAPTALILAPVLFALLTAWLYRRTAKASA